MCRRTILHSKSSPNVSNRLCNTTPFPRRARGGRLGEVSECRATVKHRSKESRFKEAGASVTIYNEFLP